MSKPNETSFPCCSHSPSAGDKLSIEACNDWLYFTCRENGDRAEVVLDRHSVKSLRDQLTSWLGDDKPECKCNMRTKLVGDGCAVCNPERAKDLEEG